MTSEHAYRELTPFSNFSEGAFDGNFYVDLPADWLVLSADIEDSTGAVAAGQYEAVNFVGAACIAALNNAMPELQYPRIFGGDGAQAVVPGQYRDTAHQTLLQLAHWSASAHGLKLIVGIVPMADILGAGGRLSAGKLRSASGVDIAMFHGDGLAMAEAMILADTDGRYRLSGEQTAPPDLQDLSCRWSPIVPSRDHMLCVIIGERRNRDDSAGPSATLADVIAKIDAIVALESDETNPAAGDKLGFKVRWTAMKKELTTRSGAALTNAPAVFGFHLFAWLLFRFKLRAGDFDARRYVDEIAGNSDYVKVAGNVRMVLDCTDAQADSIEKMLEQQYRHGKLNYGVYRARQALMTCITPDVSSGDHIHYIDGSDGGLWNAASQYKRRACS